MPQCHFRSHRQDAEQCPSTPGPKLRGRLASWSTPGSFVEASPRSSSETMAGPNPWRQPTLSSRCVERRCQTRSSWSDATVLDDYALTTTTICCQKMRKSSNFLWPPAIKIQHVFWDCWPGVGDEVGIQTKNFLPKLSISGDLAQHEVKPDNLICIFDVSLITVHDSGCCCVSDINNLQGSVATHLRCGGVFYYHFTNNKLSYRRGTARRAMLVNACYVSRGTGV